MLRRVVNHVLGGCDRVTERLARVVSDYNMPTACQPVARGSSERRATPLDLDQISAHPGGGASPSERNAKLTHRT
jgi:hypothetical protein